MSTLSQMMEMMALGAASPSDPYWAMVQSLLHFDGVNGSTVFTDATGKRTWAATSATISTVSPKFGTGSGLFAAGGYIACSSATGMDLSTSDFAIEFWWKPSSTASARYRTIFQGDSGGQILLQTASTSSNALIFYGNGATADLSETSAASNDAWHFYKLSRNGTALTLERDGAVTASATISPSKVYSCHTLRIGTGSGGGSSYYIESSIEDFRYTVGTGRPGSGVPTSAFPDH